MAVRLEKLNRNDVREIVRDVLSLDQNVEIRDGVPIAKICHELESIDLLEIFRKLCLNPSEYCQGEGLNLYGRAAAKDAIEKEGTQLNYDDEDKLKDLTRTVSTIDILPYLTTGHLFRIYKFKPHNL